MAIHEMYTPQFQCITELHNPESEVQLKSIAYIGTNIIIMMA